MSSDPDCETSELDFQLADLMIFSSDHLQIIEQKVFSGKDAAVRYCLFINNLQALSFL